MGIGGVNGISGIGRMQDYSIQMPQPAKTVIVEETGAESHVASSEQINSGNSGAVKEEAPAAVPARETEAVRTETRAKIRWDKYD